MTSKARQEHSREDQAGGWRPDEDTQDAARRIQRNVGAGIMDIGKAVKK
jgi:hypothetical protein